jgi:2-keto-3-deoxy-6-phosphogluconate aldolase
MQKEQIITKLKECGLVAVIRAKNTEEALKSPMPASKAASQESN